MSLVRSKSSNRGENDDESVSIASNKAKPTGSLDKYDQKTDLQSEEKVGSLLNEQVGVPDKVEILAGREPDFGRSDRIGGLRPHENVRQGLNQRHIQMLALAGAIGTGIFLSSGKALVHAGPVGLLLGYLTTSSVVIAMMLSLGELSALAPTSGSYVRHATMMVDRGLGFSIGWNLAVGSAVSIPGELVSCYVLVQYWTGDSLSPAIFITVFGLLILFTNLFMIRIYGEVEFVFAMIKILLIVGLIIFGICIDAGAGPDGEAIGFRFWKNPGPFAAYLVTGATGKFLGYWSVLNTAAYSFAGVESVAMAAAETKSPRQNIPKACKRIFFRIALFYILSLFVVSLIVSSSDSLLLNSTGTASASPFVIAAHRAGINSVASLINGIVLTSAWSSANHGILSGSRSLYGLALDGNAPRIFLKTHRLGVPYVGVSAIAIFMTLAYMTVSKSGTVVFGWFQSLTAASTLFQWITIGITYLRFFYATRVQGIDRSLLPYRSPLQPYLAWWALGGSFLILLTGGFKVFVHTSSEGFDVQSFFSSYFFPVFNIICYVGFKVVKKTKIVALDQVPIEPWLKEARDFPEEPLRKPKGWRKILYFLWA